MLWCLTGNGNQLKTAPKPGISITFQLFISAANALWAKYKALGVVVAFSLYWQKKGKLTF